jgi:hypothetical protein
MRYLRASLTAARLAQNEHARVEVERDPKAP